MEIIRRIWLPAVLTVQMAALACLGWLVWDTREVAINIGMRQPDPVFAPEPMWVEKLQRSIEETGGDARRAADAAESASRSAERACRELGSYNC